MPLTSAIYVKDNDRNRCYNNKIGEDMKIEVPLERANRIINSGQVILVTSGDDKAKNIITLAWSMPLSHKPPLMAICITKKRFSYELIQKTGEFAVNIPTIDLLEQVVYCGTHSGRDVDKFKEAKLTAEKSDKLKYAPLIKECIGHLECRIYFEKEAGDHMLIAADILHASAEKELFDIKWKVNNTKLIYHLGDKFFTTPEKEIIV